ncbi:MAG TPA: HAD-IA family hydrolase [Sedimentibacter sp.]|nr:HAD-IA family hydrolase [Sedimentibacter sp.]HRC82099.1 HAD-IA family hydrolase [Sedimentibacter sp.]
MKYKYLIFDFDGTLADTEEANFIIYQKLAEKYNLRNITLDELGHLKRMSAKDVMAYIELKKRYLPFLLKKGKKLLTQDIKSINLCKPDIFEIIGRLRQMGIKTAIITTNSKKNVKLFLEAHNVDVIDLVVSAAMFGKEAKMKKIVRKGKLDLSEYLYVGDEIRDITAARKAGMDIASVAWGYNTVESLKSHKPDYLIYEPSQLIEIVQGRYNQTL